MIKLTPEKMPYYEIAEQIQKKYMAQLTQTGTANPTAIIQLDQIGITWVRTAAGTYKATLPDDITLKTNILATGSNNASIISTSSNTAGPNTEIVIKTTEFNGSDWVDVDNKLNRTNIQLTIFT